MRRMSIRIILFTAIFVGIFLSGCPITTESTAESPKELTSFSIVNPAAAGVITSTSASNTIAVSVPSGTDRTSLVAAFTTTGISVKVGSVVQVSGVTANDFTNPVNYVVTAEDETFSVYTVTLTAGSGTSSSKAITNFSILGNAGIIDEAAKTITVTLPTGTDVTSLVAVFTTTGVSVKLGSTIQTSGVTANDYSSPVVLTVTAADASTVAYTVTVNVTPPVLYISNFGDSTVSVINGLDGSPITTINVGTNPAGVGVNPITKKIYVANYGAGTVSFIDGTTYTLGSTLPLAGVDP